MYCTSRPQHSRLDDSSNISDECQSASQQVFMGANESTPRAPGVSMIAAAATQSSSDISMADVSGIDTSDSDVSMTDDTGPDVEMDEEQQDVVENWQQQLISPLKKIKLYVSGKQPTGSDVNEVAKLLSTKFGKTPNKDKHKNKKHRKNVLRKKAPSSVLPFKPKKTVKHLKAKMRGAKRKSKRSGPIAQARNETRSAVKKDIAQRTPTDMIFYQRSNVSAWSDVAESSDVTATSDDVNVHNDGMRSTNSTMWDLFARMRPAIAAKPIEKKLRFAEPLVEKRSERKIRFADEALEKCSSEHQLNAPEKNRPLCNSYSLEYNKC